MSLYSNVLVSLNLRDWAKRIQNILLTEKEEQLFEEISSVCALNFNSVAMFNGIKKWIY